LRIECTHQAISRSIRLTTLIGSMAAPTVLYTFGYEGLSIEAFIQRLKEMRVQFIVDVRELPLSRKKGFSKSSFRAQLAVAGIAYEHRPALGCPRSVREQYRSDGSWPAYTRAFLAHLVKQKAEVQSLVSTALAQHACLVCYEANPEDCHRTFVARAAHALGAPPVLHITARTAFADPAKSLAA
jgi:uncharacterized protein (DUF488 family)